MVHPSRAPFLTPHSATPKDIASETGEIRSDTQLYHRTNFHADRWIIAQISDSKQNKNLAIANRSRVSCAHNTLRASIGVNITH